MAGKQDVRQAAGAAETTRAVKLVYTPEARDIAEALRARGRLTRRRDLLRVGLLAAAAFVVLLAVSVAGDTPSPVVPPAVGTLSGVLVGGVAFLVVRRVQVRAVHRFARTHGECRTTVDDSGMRTVTAGMDSRIGWDMYPRYVETANLFVALSRDKGAVGVAMLPKRGLRHPDDVDRLREIIDRNAVRAGRTA